MKLAHPFKFGYGIAVEQRTPTECLKMASDAEKAGFDSAWFSDHFHPSFDTNACGGLASVCMASAAKRTRKIHYGTAITCPCSDITQQSLLKHSRLWVRCIPADSSLVLESLKL